jgi:uncharacterized protein
MSNHVILLPPSEGKAVGGSPDAGASLSFPALDEPRTEVARALTAAMADEAAAGKLLGVKGTALRAAIVANTSLDGAPVLPAIERYTGVLYDNLDAASLTGPARRRLRDGVIILSGLWGLVRPTDAIPDYKLKMGTTLPPLGRLATWWRGPLSDALDEEVHDRLVWDLLPKAHAAAWTDPDASPALRVTVSFEVEQRKGRQRVRSTVTHWSKALKGALAHHLLNARPVRPERGAVIAALEAFSHPEGYALERVEGDGHLHATFVTRRGA